MAKKKLVLDEDGQELSYPVGTKMVVPRPERADSSPVPKAILDMCGEPKETWKVAFGRTNHTCKARMHFNVEPYYLSDAKHLVLCDEKRPSGKGGRYGVNVNGTALDGYGLNVEGMKDRLCCKEGCPGLCGR